MSSPTVNGIPPELLLEIFTCDVLVFGVAPSSLLSICSYWKEVVLDAPLLWTKVTIRSRSYTFRSEQQAKQIAITALHLSRSQRLPLDINLEGCSSAVLQLLIGEIRRWRSFRVSKIPIEPFWPIIVSSPAPLLQKLDISMNPMTLTQQQLTNYVAKMAIDPDLWPVLESIRAETCNSQSHIHSLKTLTSVRSLDLDWALADLGSLKRALVQSSTIQNLSITLRWSLFNLTPCDIPQLPNLTGLSLTGRFNTSWLNTFSTVAPSISRLQLSYTGCTPTPLTSEPYPVFQKLQQLWLNFHQAPAHLLALGQWLPKLSQSVQELHIGLDEASFTLATLQPIQSTTAFDIKCLINALIAFPDPESESGDTISCMEALRSVNLHCDNTSLKEILEVFRANHRIKVDAPTLRCRDRSGELENMPCRVMQQALHATSGIITKELEAYWAPSVNILHPNSR